jgi:hypothetical protein
MSKATIRISLKTIAMRFPAGSIERVYLHGTWQMERGRNPSMLYGNHHSARVAYAAAKAMLGSYFDEIRRQHYARQDFFWSDQMIVDVTNRVPVRELRLMDKYR